MNCKCDPDLLGSNSIIAICILVINCAKLFKQNFIGLKVMEGTRNVDFYTFDLDLWCSNPMFAFCTCSYTGYQLCQDIF
jgi:hypothetical protein